MAMRPNARQWLFSLKAFLAAMLALYIALALGLPRPYWAMATVYFVSHPLTGATRSKAAYRVAGTVLGAAAAVATVPLLVNMPIVLMAAISLWIVALVYLSTLQRSPRAYVFLLAAYTLPIVALPAVDQPAQIFDVAVARIEEIVIGIVCAGLVGSVILPAKVAPALRARAASWLGDAAAWADDILCANPREDAGRHRLAADILALDQLIAQLSYDTESAASLRHARALRTRMTALMPLLSALSAVLQALRMHPAGVPDSLAQLLAGLSQWLRTGMAGPAPRADRAAPADAAADAWHGCLLTAANSQLARLAALCSDCAALQHGIGDRPDRPLPKLSAMPTADAAPGRGAHHHDHGMLLFGAVSTGLAVFCAGLLWIFSGWTDGAGAVAVASIACCFFATIDEPRPVARSFLRWSAVCLVVASFYLFLVVPHAQSFETLAGMLAVPYLGIGMLIARPGFNLIAMLLSVNTASFANIQSVYDANFLGTFNGSLANAAAMLFAPLWALATRPFGASVAAHRLIRASWHDLAGAAAWPGADHDAKLGARMLDRLGQLVPRLGASRAGPDGFSELHVGFCALALRRALPSMPAAARRPVRRVLALVARHYRARLRHGDAIATTAALPGSIDAAIAQVGALPGNRDDAIAALVVLRVTLHQPDTPGMTDSGAGIEH
ncbi:p-hydroxybenzoic acid efflux pump subunit AaeB [Cupriavidus yeoncheonensis]|uniref:p-hydroxybenzoic acid efflux pump subunit AaeB n=1 Tax=Cupriavidus yeoncheonensis TaxID=1462994 RepID=A0A916IRC7_9BURK|nr:FUSC family protein [Cupriavidus yeoncheonensis]CAG2134175.1 p-hydroxybenzoic acid efflux pump subunit AaeB [Cupriavidus yeoncheonensis]